MATAARLDTLAEIREKVLANERLDFDDGVALLETDDLTGLGELADTARRLRGGGDEVFFVNNLYLNHTNVCRVKCKFCAFAMTGKQPQAYTGKTANPARHAATCTVARATRRSTWWEARIPTSSTATTST